MKIRTVQDKKKVTNMALTVTRGSKPRVVDDTPKMALTVTRESKPRVVDDQSEMALTVTRGGESRVVDDTPKIALTVTRGSESRVVDDTEEEEDSKHYCTASINHEDSQDPTVEPIASATISANAVAVAIVVAVATTVSTTVSAAADDEQPSTTFKLAEVLCNIVSDRYSYDEKLRTLEKLRKWASTEDGDFLKLFHACGGVLSVLNFLIRTMDDGNCVGAVRIECIDNAALIIVDTTYPGENNVNEDIAKKIATSLMECDGINALINASEEYSGGDDVPQLNALCSIWLALKNITCNRAAMKDVSNKDQATALFDTGIDIISQLKSVDDPKASSTLELVFETFFNIVSNDYVTKKNFQDNDILSKCLEVVKKDDAWTWQDEEFLRSLTLFFISCCVENLLVRISDYEMILPLLVVVLKEYTSNSRIRNEAMDMLDGACSLVTDKKIIERSGAVEVLGALLKSNDINEAAKNTVRTLINKIIAP